MPIGPVGTTVPPADIDIERATTEDLEAVADAWVRLARDQASYGSHVLAEPNRQTMLATLGAYQVDGGLLVARETETIVGFASVTVEHGSLTLDCTRGLLSNLYVEPEYRGRGIGTALLEAAENELRERGVDVCTLEAMARNESACRFYREAGYDSFRIGFERRL
ncbi:GNAT family N-acetyltransferase [Natrialbaceae archaeon A-CW2]